MIYLDNAATSFPKPEQVYVTMQNFLKEAGANPGRAGHQMAVKAEALVEQTRDRLAKFFGCKDPHRIIFTLNATDALNLAIKGLLKPGDHVVTSWLEHNSVSRPLESLRRKGIITVTKVDYSSDGFIDPDDIRKAIKSDTKLVAVTHASNVLGTIQPIEGIGEVVETTDAFFLVDAAQTAGAYPIDVNEARIDLLAFPGHKSLLGPPGTGGLWVSERVELAPWREGGTGANSEALVQPEELPFRLEGGTPNTVGIAGLGEGIKFIQEQGLDKIMKHEQNLMAKLMEGLSQNGQFQIYGSTDVKRKVCTLSFNIENVSPVEVGTILDQSFNIAVRTGLHCAPFVHQRMGTFPEGAVRISPGYFNTPDDIVVFLDAIQKLLRIY